MVSCRSGVRVSTVLDLVSCRRRFLAACSATPSRTAGSVGRLLGRLRLLFLLRFLFVFLRTDYDAGERKTTNGNNKYSHKILSFELLDLFRFAFIQRGNPLLWMHVPLKPKTRSIAADVLITPVVDEQPQTTQLLLL